MRASPAFTPIATSCCCAPSWMSRSMRRRSASAASTSARRARSPSTSNRSRRRAITSEAAIATARNTSCAGPRNRANGSPSTATVARATHHAPATTAEAIGGEVNVDSTRLESDRASAGSDPRPRPRDGARRDERGDGEHRDRRDHDRHAAREHHREPGDGRRAHRLEHRVRPRAVGGRDAGERHDRRDRRGTAAPGRGRPRPRSPRTARRRPRRRARAAAATASPRRCPPRRAAGPRGRRRGRARGRRRRAARSPVSGPGSVGHRARSDHQRGSPAASGRTGGSTSGV